MRVPHLEDVGRPSSEQLVEHNSEGVDVCGGRNRRAAYLFRTCVLRGHRPELRGLGASRWIQDLCDTEIQQLRRAIVADEDISWLDVAVDDQVLVGILHRSADLPKEFQSRGDRESTLIAVLIDR